MHAVIHCNPGIEWQRRYAKALKQGLENELIPAKITAQRDELAHLRIILGPHWGIKDGLIIDRAFWGDPNAVSIHWLIRGCKVFDWTPREGRYYPDVKPYKTGKKGVVLCDYGKRFAVPGCDIRFHPSEKPNQPPLAKALEKYAVAYGGHSTALVDAAINGLTVYSLLDGGPVGPISGKTKPDREPWLQALSWHNWTFEEIEKGVLWNHFIKSKP